jgi:microcin C transport system permease protein
VDVKLEAEEKIRVPQSLLGREELRPDVEPAGPMGVTAPPLGFEFSPLNARRWRNFKANRRGHFSLWMFLALFILSLFAELIANDRPLFIHFDGKNYFPVFVTYPDTEFGDTLGTAADYRDPYIQRFLDEHHATVIWAPIRFSYRTINDRPPSAFPSKPTWLLNKRDCDFAAKNGYSQCGALEMNWFGTDDQGRDVLARLIYGFRISVLFGLILTIVSSIIGVAAGAVQGYFGGWTDLLFQRVIEIWTSVPELYLLLIISSVLVPGLFRHLLPNAMVATMTFLPFIMSSSVMTLTALDFLGFGLPPGSPSLGELLSQAKGNVQAPWLGLTGFFTVALMLSLLIFIGEAVRDAFDPRKTFT